MRAWRNDRQSPALPGDDEMNPAGEQPAPTDRGGLEPETALRDPGKLEPGAEVYPPPATGGTLTGRHRHGDESRGPTRASPLSEGDAFEAWVDRQLAALYQPVCREPVPALLVELLEEAVEAIERAGRAAGEGSRRSPRR